MASRNGLAALVLAGPVFSQGKNESPILQMISTKQKFWCDFWTHYIKLYSG